MLDRFRRSWALMRQSYGVLMKDKELLFLPMMSGLCIASIICLFAMPMAMFKVEISKWGELATLAFFGGAYVLLFSVGIFFQAALVSGAIERMSGGDPTIGSALRGAARRWKAILAWGLVAGTVGLVIKMIESRSELLGRIIMFFVGAAWTLSTFFMIPLLVMEDDGIKDSYRRSCHLIQETWGESVIGGSGFGLIGSILMIPFFLVGFVLLEVHLALGMSFMAIGGAAAAVFITALDGVFVASLYLYASDRELDEGFDEAYLEAAFRPK